MMSQLGMFLYVQELPSIFRDEIHDISTTRKTGKRGKCRRKVYTKRNFPRKVEDKEKLETESLNPTLYYVFPLSLKPL